MTQVTIRRALLSVSDKSGVVELASRLAGRLRFERNPD